MMYLTHSRAMEARPWNDNLVIAHAARSGMAIPLRGPIPPADGPDRWNLIYFDRKTRRLARLVECPPGTDVKLLSHDELATYWSRAH